LELHFRTAWSCTQNLCTDDLFPRLSMYDYNPWPAGTKPLVEKIKKHMIVPEDQILPIIDELIEILKKDGPM
jgi:hypothetical protein